MELNPGKEIEAFGFGGKVNGEPTVGGRVPPLPVLIRAVFPPLLV
jgi:hypothetical protein